MANEMDEKYYELFKKKMELVQNQIEYFLKHELYTWQWWSLLAMTIVPWLLWIFFRRKEIQARLLLGGLFAGLIALVFDLAGTQSGFWRYGIKLIPSLPPLVPYDLALMPISFCFILQLSKTRNQYLLFSVLISVFTAFVFEPFLDFINVYKSVVWKHYYSVPGYFLIYWSSYKISSLNGWKQLFVHPK